MISKITAFIIAAIMILILTFGVLLVLFLYYRKKKASSLKEETSYRDIPVEDATSFIPIEDIREDMVIDKDGKRFTAAIICTGSDFFYESVDEKIRIQKNYIGFWHLIRSDISFRQSAENINLDTTISNYEKAHDRVEKMYYNLSVDYQNYREEYDRAYANNEPINPQFEEALLGMQKQLNSLKFRLVHIEDQLRLARRMAGPGAESQKNVMMYVFSWNQPTGLMGENLTGEALIMKATQELQKMADQFIRALAGCGVSARRATTNELIDQFRKQTHPVTGNTFLTEDIQTYTSWTEDVTQTNTFSKAKERYMDDVADRIIYGGAHGSV